MLSDIGWKLDFVIRKWLDILIISLLLNQEGSVEILNIWKH